MFFRQLAGQELTGGGVVKWLVHVCDVVMRAVSSADSNNQCLDLHRERFEGLWL
jgi:hypothetical protein